MSKRMSVFVLFALCALLALTWTTNYNPVAAAPQQAAGAPAAKLTPAQGYDVHVLAPHLVNGKIMGPYHHYCKVYTPDPKIVCLIYESTEPNAVMTQVEYFVAKTVSRPNVPLAAWNKYYHDHAEEIATGRVQVLDVSPEEAKKIAAAAAQTDGIIFHLWWPMNAKAPNGEVKHPQSVGHKPRTK